MDGNPHHESLSQAASGQTGSGRRQSQSTDQYAMNNMNSDGLLVIDKQSAFPGAEPASPALWSFPNSTPDQCTRFDPSSFFSQLLDEVPPAADLDPASSAFQDFPSKPSRRYSDFHDHQTFQAGNSISSATVNSPDYQSQSQSSALPSSVHADVSNRPVVSSPFSTQNYSQHPFGQQQQQSPQLPTQPKSAPPQNTRERAPSQPWSSRSFLPSVATALRNIDTISLRSLHTQATLGPDSWARPRSQPLILSLYLAIDTTAAAHADSIAQTFSYGVMAKEVVSKIEGKEFMSIDHLTSDLASLADNWPGESLRIVAKAPKALLRTSDGLERELCLQRREHEAGERMQLVWHVLRHEWTVGGLDCACIIGLNDHERLEKQSVAIKIRAAGEREKEEYGAQIREGGEMWRRLVRGVCELVEPSSFKTLEALAAHVARYCLEHFPFPAVTVGVEKPSALTFVDGAGVEITRDRQWLSVR